MRPALALLVLLIVGGADARPPRAKSKPQPYVAISIVRDKGNRAELVKLADEQLRRKVAQLGAVLAPAGETPKAAKAAIRKRRTKGFELQAELSNVPGGGLRLSVLCFTYPGKSLLGEVSVKGAGGRQSDLVKALAAKVVEDAADTFDWGT